MRIQIQLMVWIFLQPLSIIKFHQHLSCRKNWLRKPFSAHKVYNLHPPWLGPMVLHPLVLNLSCPHSFESAFIFLLGSLLTETLGLLSPHLCDSTSSCWYHSVFLPRINYIYPYSENPLGSRLLYLQIQMCLHHLDIIHKSFLYPIPTQVKRISSRGRICFDLICIH